MEAKSSSVVAEGGECGVTANSEHGISLGDNENVLKFPVVIVA